LREGEILGYRNGKVFLKRKFHGSGSFYDGLEVPKEEGDYGITEAQEDLWSLRHSYFGSDGQLKGELYNINTPVEFYPGKIRYVDLEVDVVKPVGQDPRIIDKDKLTEAVEEGHLNERLATKAFEIGQELLKQLRERQL
jgi:Ribonuclease G/E